MIGCELQTGMGPIKVMQFICPTGYYGAERWITALLNNTDPQIVEQSLLVTDESHGDEELDLCLAVGQLGITVHKVHMRNRFDLRAIVKLKQLLKDEQIDVLHTHGYKSDIIGVLAAKLAGVACVSTPHGFENTRDIKLRLFIALGNFTFRFFDKVAPLSETLRDDVLGMGVKLEQIEYIPNGVDLKDIDRKRAILNQSLQPTKVENASSHRTLGYIGQLISRKNVSDLILVFESLADTDDSLKLLIVGDGDERPLLEVQASKSVHASRIEFRGFVTDAIPIYVEIDLFLMTSTLEGVPRCLMEAMAMSVPVVAYDIPGVRDLVTHEQTGMLVPFGDTALMVRMCKKLLSDKFLYSDIVAKARLNVENDYSAKSKAMRYSGLYEQMRFDSSVQAR